MSIADNKVKTRAEVALIIKKARAKGIQTIGFTSGAFDILHPGHIDYLEESRKRCDLLIVGINSDSSIKEYKNKLRPVVGETARAHVVAALASVDFVFIFQEKNNNQNISDLKPDVYFKAGDYSKDKLTSAPLVEAYGGKVEVVGFKQGYSTTDIVDRVINTFLDGITKDEGPTSYQIAPAVFLDRDGTLIRHVEYLHEPEKLELFSDTISSLKRLREAGFRLVIVTNQPGIGLGYFTREDFFSVNRKLLRSLAEGGVMVDRVFFCPHSAAEHCECKKPGVMLFKRAEAELNLDLKRSFMIGDHEVDIGSAKKLGLKSVLLGQTDKKSYGEDFCAKTLSNATEWILKCVN